MGNKPGYYEKWYGKNREKLADRRKERYDSDPEYRQRVLSASASYRQKKRNTTRVRVPRHQTPRIFKTSTMEVPLFSIGGFASYINRAIQSINHWEKNSLLPRTPYRVGERGFRYYSAGMMEVVRQIVGNRRRLFPVDPTMHDRIREGWEAMGVPMDCNEGIDVALEQTDFEQPQMPPAMCEIDECYEMATSECEDEDGEVFLFCSEHAKNVCSVLKTDAMKKINETLEA